MKLKNIAIVAAAAALAVGMTACGSSASSTAASSSVASSAAASSEAASSEAAVEPAEYTVYNTTGTNVAELYLYAVGSEDKGENLAGEGLADGESVVLTLPEDADTSAKYVLEFTTDGGATPLKNVTLVDDKCQSVSGPTKTGGDQDALLEQGETWTYSCTSTLQTTTTNIATASGKDTGFAAIPSLREDYRLDRSWGPLNEQVRHVLKSFGSLALPARFELSWAFQMRSGLRYSRLI